MNWERRSKLEGEWVTVFSVPGLKTRLIEEPVGFFTREYVQEEEAVAEHKSDEQIRRFASGATRTVDNQKPRFEGFLSPLAIQRYGEYMHQKREMPDGSQRDPDNWQLGIPQQSYIDSLIRHLLDLWLHHDGFPEQAVDAEFETVLCALLFNVHGLLHETVKARVQNTRLSASHGQESKADSTHALGCFCVQCCVLTHIKKRTLSPVHEKEEAS